MRKGEALKYMLNPDTIAIVGASSDPKKLSGRLLSNILDHGFKGKIFPVNPKEDHIQGLKCFHTIREIPRTIDLAFLMVPARAVPDVLQDCIENEVRSVVIGTSGFAESGKAGIQLQQRISETAKWAGLRFCGPNSIGLCNFLDGIYASFSSALGFPEAKKGNIAFLTQSGAMGGSMLSRGWENGIGFSRFISTGNEADIETPEYIDFLVDDDRTKVIAVLLEGIADSAKFKIAARKALQVQKPIVVFKSGKTRAGKQSVKSHTGVLAGDHEVYKAFFKQYGIVDVEEISELFNVARAFATQPLPEGQKVGIVSTSGGACSILADLCIDHGLEIPPFASETVGEIGKVIPEYGAVNNPIDTTAQLLANPGMYKQVLRHILNDGSIDSMIMMLTTVAEPMASNIARDIVEVCRDAKKPLLLVWTIAERLARGGMKIIRDSGIPLYERPESAVNALKTMVWYKSRYWKMIEKSKRKMATDFFLRKGQTDTLRSAGS